MRSSAARQFRTATTNLEKWLQVVDNVAYLSRTAVPKGDRKRYVVGARRVVTAARAMGTSRAIVPFEGAYLYVCAEFEWAVRELIEDFGNSVALKVKRFSDLPERLQKRNVTSSAIILGDFDADRFPALTQFDVISKLHTCLDPSTPDHGYEICEEALSYSRRNFRWKVIKEVFGDLGVANMMATMSADGKVQKALGVSSAGTVESMLPRELDQIIDTRNRIIHRSGVFTSPTSADVRRIIKTLRAIVSGLEKVLTSHYRTL